MNTAIWTLWLITFGSVQGNGGAPVSVVPLATFQNQQECLTSINSVIEQLRVTYTGSTPPTPGIMICVHGVLVKR